jgi:hypothetical protein
MSKVAWSLPNTVLLKVTVSTGVSVKWGNKVRENSEIGYRGDIHPLTQHAYMAWCLVKHSDDFTFTFTAESLIEMLFMLPKQY